MDYNLITSGIETFGLGTFIFYMIRSLKVKITSLKDTIDIQGKTLDVMEKRISETEKVGEIYKNLLSDIPKDLENYKAIISKTKDESIIELKNQNELTEKKLKEVEKQIKKNKKSPDVIEKQLMILKILLSKYKNESTDVEETFELAKICEFGDLTLEKCVPILVDSNTLDDFFKAVGLLVEITEDENISQTVFGPNSINKSPKGNPVQYASSAGSIYSGWHFIVNDEFYLNNKRMKLLKWEFDKIKKMYNKSFQGTLLTSRP